jgi:ATP-binding cassette subfamily B multidrug efflux pump
VSSGEIMSRATNDLAQVRLLVGFGALNLVNTAFAYAVNIPLLFCARADARGARAAAVPLLRAAHAALRAADSSRAAAPPRRPSAT